MKQEQPLESQDETLINQDKVEVKTESVPEPPQDQPPQVENKDFEQMVDAALETKDDVKKAEQEEKTALAAKLTEDEAAEFAIQGLEEVVAWVEDQTGTQTELPKVAVMAYASLVTPCIMKHGPTIKRLMSKTREIPEDSYLIEVMAVGGVAAVGIPLWLQLRKARQQQGSTDGNQQ